MEFKKYHKIHQFRDVVRDIQFKANYKGKDENDSPIYEESIKPTVFFKGTVKLHGTNIQVAFDGKELLAGKRSSLIGKDQLEAHFGFNRFVHTTHKDYFQNLLKELHSTYCKEGQQIILYGEFAGCFTYDTPILLVDGSTRSIGQIVNNKESIEILSYNKDTQKLEPKKVVGWHNNGESDDWLKIGYKRRKRGGKDPYIKVTPNHKIFTKKGNKIVEVLAKDLKEGDILLTNGDIISTNQLDFIKGSILGDGSIGKRDRRHFSVSHSENVQTFYNTFIEKLLGNISSNVERISGHGSPMCGVYTKSLNEIEDIFEELYTHGIKTPNIEFLNKLNAKSLAAWYMDDGTLTNHSGKNRRRQASLMTLGWSKNVNETISKWFDSRGYENYICKDDSYNETKYYIRFTPKGTLRFLSDICYYMLPEFDYKLPDFLRGKIKYNWFECLGEYEKGLIETTVTSVELYKPKERYKRVKYDITVEDNNNYFANRVLVHNSGIQKGVGISELSKACYFFDAKVYDKISDKTEWLDISDWKFEEPDVHNIHGFQTYGLNIDFNKPQAFQNILAEITENVEKECPVAKQLGIDNGCGEGVVWTGFWKDEKFIFKVKGEAHSTTKVKKLASVDPEVLKSIEDFVTYAATVNRIEQGIQETEATEKKDVPTLLRWVYKDIIDEDIDVLEANNLKWSQVARDINDKVVRHFFEKINKL